ncbi:sensor histidine kinase [Vibrio sp. CAU 1672]|uniref:sensor histidine kinase n=1 Tax=Vibrio sp. CAU 1672 TaxID=3032594 RepID=UPI0023DC581A|nr:sensor histidine kinase [Vibrio sp. CAU 1672]MDF2155227.1 sensor histidine kinase [Vibrio sp. CAU 1672]
MMSVKSLVLPGWWRSLFVTTLFCLFISTMTLSVWGGGYYIHVAISFGFGYSALFFSWLIDRWFPAVPRMMEVALSLTACLAVGLLNARFWTSDFFAISDMVPVGLMGLLFSAMCYFYFLSKENQAIAERELETIKREKAEQERALLLSQLKQLQSQMEPHFLFNTLANISALMSHDVDKAKQMLEQLTALLRSTLNSSRQETTCVADEVALIEAYLSIQRIRLGDRLRFHIVVDDGLQQTELPPMLLQPLVENAIIHGIEPKRDGGSVTLTIARHEQCLNIEVKDTGVGLSHNSSHNSSHNGSGVGLSNLKQRLETLFAGQASLSVTEPPCGGTCVRLSWPLA